MDQWETDSNIQYLDACKPSLLKMIVHFPIANAALFGGSSTKQEPGSVQ